MAPRLPGVCFTHTKLSREGRSDNANPRLVGR